MNEDTASDWRFDYDPAAAKYEPGQPLTVGQRISVACLHPDCLARRKLFTYTYGRSPVTGALGKKGGPVRKFCSEQHRREWNAYGEVLPDGRRRLTWPEYEVPAVPADGRDFVSDGWRPGSKVRDPLVTRQTAFKAAVRIVHAVADEYDQWLRRLIARVQPGESVGVEPPRDPYKQPATPEPGGIAVQTIVIAEPGQRTKDDSPFDTALIEHFMGERRVERRDPNFVGGDRGDTGVDYTGSINDAGATREEYGSPPTARVDFEARDPMFRESKDRMGDMFDEATRDVAKEAEGVAELVTTTPARAGGGLRGRNPVQVVIAAFAEWLIGKPSPAQYQIVHDLQDTDPLQAALLEGQARDLLLGAMKGSSKEDLERLNLRLFPPSPNRRGGPSRPGNNGARRDDHK